MVSVRRKQRSRTPSALVSSEEFVRNRDEEQASRPVVKPKRAVAQDKHGKAKAKGRSGVRRPPAKAKNRGGNRRDAIVLAALEQIVALARKIGDTLKEAQAAAEEESESEDEE